MKKQKCFGFWVCFFPHFSMAKHEFWREEAENEPQLADRKLMALAMVASNDWLTSVAS